jgi:hypothetical protein
MQEIEQKLSELESKSLNTATKIAHISGQQRCLLLINDPAKIPSAITWIKSHFLEFYDVTAVVKSEDLSSPIVLSATEQIIAPPFLKSLIQTLQYSLNPSILSLFALPPLELSTTTTSLLRKKIDLVLIIGCRCLSRGEYENVAEFEPLFEEIILKEAIQPVILFK